MFLHKTRCKSDPTSPKNAKVRTMKSHRILSQRTHPIHRWTLNSCTGAFHNVSVHLRPFRYCIKLGANQAELVQLMQKFVQRSRIGTFRNEGTRSIPLDPKSCSGAFHNVWAHLGSFRNRKLGAKRGELVQLMQKFVPRIHVVIFSQLTHSIHPV